MHKISSENLRFIGLAGTKYPEVAEYFKTHPTVCWDSIRGDILRDKFPLDAAKVVLRKLVRRGRRRSNVEDGMHSLMDGDAIFTDWQGHPMETAEAILDGAKFAHYLSLAFNHESSTFEILFKAFGLDYGKFNKAAKKEGADILCISPEFASAEAARKFWRVNFFKPAGLKMSDYIKK